MASVVRGLPSTFQIWWPRANLSRRLTSATSGSANRIGARTVQSFRDLVSCTPVRPSYPSLLFLGCVGVGLYGINPILSNPIMASIPTLLATGIPECVTPEIYPSRKTRHPLRFIIPGLRSAADLVKTIEILIDLVCVPENYPEGPPPF